MLKQSIIALSICAICVAGASTAAFAGKGGHKGGYDPLWWNGPAGYDHTDLFEKRGYRGGYGPSYSKRGDCGYFERKYVRTGLKIWLRKFEVCVAG